MRGETLAGKLVALGAGATIALASVADVTFPTAGGDIADPAAWGRDTLPSSSDKVVFTMGSCTYTASADVSFGQMSFSGNAAVLDLSSAGGRTLSLGSSSPAFCLSGYGLTHTIKGGVLSVREKDFYVSEEWKTGNRLVLDGVEVSGVSRFYIGQSNVGTSSLVMTNGATLSAGSVLLSNSGNYGGHDVLEINAGCKFTSLGDFWVDRYGDRADNVGYHSVLVQGVGANLTCGGTFYGGGRHDYNVLRVTKGASLMMDKYYSGGDTTDSGGLSTADSHGHRFEIDDGASAVLTGNVLIGVCSSDNRLLVSNATMSARSIYLGKSTDTANNNLALITGGSNVTLEKYFNVGEKGSGNELCVNGGSVFTAGAYGTNVGCGNESVGNRLIVSNASFSTSTLQIGVADGASNNIVKISGAAARFSVTLPWEYPFGVGGYGTFELSDHATFTTCSSECKIGANSAYNVFRVVDGASVEDLSDNLTLSSSTCADSFANRIEIGSGASYRMLRFYIYGHDNVLFISNGLFQVDSPMANAMMVGNAPAGASVETARNELRFSGSAPRLRFTSNAGGVRMLNSSHLTFAIPEGGYSEIPIVSSQIVMDETCEINVEDAGYVTSLAGNCGEVVLASVAGDPAEGIPQVVVDRANARLAESNQKLVWKGNDLILKTNRRGLVIFVK